MIASPGACRRTVWVAVTALCLAGLRSEDVAGSLASRAVNLSGAVTDRVRDVRASPQVPRPPDFKAARIEVSDGDLIVTVSFDKGTLSPQTSVTVYLDTDEEAATGTPVFFGERRPIGADYAIRGFQPHDPSKAALTRETGGRGRFVLIGSIDVTFPAADQRRYVVPLSQLGNDDGRLWFKLECDQIVGFSQAGNTSTQSYVTHIDQMPDAGARPGVVK